MVRRYVFSDLDERGSRTMGNKMVCIFVIMMSQRKAVNINWSTIVVTQDGDTYGVHEDVVQKEIASI
eukprot:scaffold190064_cov59-Attheya_sp.AAC.1